MNSNSPIAAALEQLQLERTNLLARVEKVDAAIATLRDLFHLPTERTIGKVTAAVNGNGHGALTTDAIRAALARGPLSPGDLAAALDVGRVPLRHRVAALEREGLLVSTGTTASRLVALAGTPAKEAP